MRRGVVVIIVVGVGLSIGSFSSKVYGLAQSTGPDGSNAQAVHLLGETGEGVSVAVISSQNTRVTHDAFKDTNNISHAYWYDFTSDGNIYEPVSHDTWVAGIVASRGDAFHPNDIGVAPDSDIHSAKITIGENGPGDPNRLIAQIWLEDALESLINDHNCRVVVSGIAFGDTPDGNSIWTKIYDYYAYWYDVVFANAAGNGNWQIWEVGDAYNGITTGGLDVTDTDVYLTVGVVSGSGPTTDQRRKPDVVAPAQNQTMPSGASDTNWYTWTFAGGHTSLSGPHTAGVAALLLGLADDTNEPDDGHNEVIKAVIVNSAFGNIDDKSGVTTNPADPNNVWHPDRGYGRVDALRAYQLLISARINMDTVVASEKGWAYATISGDGNDVYNITGFKNHRLVFTVTWNRQINKNGPIYSDESSPKFNLDVTIKDPNGQILFAKTDIVNNLEKVEIILPTDGIYQVHLKNTTSKDNRSYGLAFEILEPIIGDLDIDYIVDEADLGEFISQWLLLGGDISADIYVDGRIDLLDFSRLVANWLEIDERYYNHQ